MGSFIRGSCIRDDTENMDACNRLGHDSGKVRNVNSCKWYQACFFTADVGGSTEDIPGSCIESEACEYLSSLPRNSGNVIFSCQANFRACYAVAENGSIDRMTEACIGDMACEDKVENVLKSCLGKWACYEAAEHSGSIGEILKSCIGGEYSYRCHSLGRHAGTAGNLNNVCTKKNACDDGANLEESLQVLQTCVPCLIHVHCLGKA